MIPLAVMESPACRSLSHAEFRVLFCYAAQYNGHNNGELGLNLATAAAQGVGDATLKRARKVLEERGLIVETRKGTRTPPRPNLYALTWWPVDAGNHDARPTRVPSLKYRDWPPPAVSDGSPRPMGVGHHDPREPEKRAEIHRAVGHHDPRSAHFDGSP